MRTIIGLALAAAVAASTVERPMYEGYTYEQFLTDYERPSLLSSENGVEELLGRKAIFELNLEKIRRHNSNPNNTYWLSVNKFADMTTSEFVSKYTGRKKSEGPKNLPGTFMKTRPMVSVPSELSWVERGAIPYVTAQGSCGSCWAHATNHCLVGTASIAAKEATGRYLDRSFVPSRQQLTSCVPNWKHCGGRGGCEGNVAKIALDYVQQAGGLIPESLYPYTSGDDGVTGECKADLVAKAPKIVSVGGFKSLAANDVDALLEALQKGPVTVSVAASAWHLYGGGIFNGCHTGEEGAKQDNDVNHVVNMVGYDEKSFVIQNSWGEEWGTTACDDASNPACKMRGFIRVKRAPRGEAEKCGVDNTPADGSGCDGETDPVTVCGECGVLFDSTMITDIHVNATALGMF